MDLGHDTVHALTTIVDLINTAPEAAGREELADADDLQRFVQRHAISTPGVLGEQDVSDVRHLRARLHAVFRAADQASSVGLVNALLADVRTTPRLTDHDGWPLHMHYFAAGAPLAERLAADGGMALALMISAGERARLSGCTAPGCARVLVDLSRNRSRRYCDSRTCGNRLHVAAYRARHRQSTT